MMATGREMNVASTTSIHRRTAFDNSSPDPSFGDAKIESPLDPRTHTHTTLLLHDRSNVSATAFRASRRSELYLLSCPNCPITVLVQLAIAPTERLIAPQEHTLTLVVEVGPFVNEREIWIRECRPRQRITRLLELLDRRDTKVR